MEMPHISWATDKQVPTVKAADLKALHKFQTDLAASHPLPPGQVRVVSHTVFQKALTPGADIVTLTYRFSWLQILQFPWIKGDKIDDAVFNALAVLPLTGIPAGGTSTPPFDPDELVRLIQSGGEVI